MNATPKQSPSDTDALAEALDGTNRQRAEAISAFVDGRITAAIDGLREEVKTLVARQRDNVTVAKEEGSSEAAQAANTSTKAVKAADAAVKAAADDPTSANASEAKDKVKEAAQAVAKTETDLAARVSAVEETLAPWRKGEALGSRPASRFDSLEQDMPRLRAAVDQSASASAEALAIVRSGGRGPSLWIISLVTFAVALLVASTLAAFTSLSFFWDAWWLAAGTTVFVVLCTWILEDLVPAGTRGFAAGWASAHSEHRGAHDHDAGLDIMTAEAEANANASTH